MPGGAPTPWAGRWGVFFEKHKPSCRHSGSHSRLPTSDIRSYPVGVSSGNRGMTKSGTKLSFSTGSLNVGFRREQTFRTCTMPSSIDRFWAAARTRCAGVVLDRLYEMEAYLQRLKPGTRSCARLNRSRQRVKHTDIVWHSNRAKRATRC